MKELFLPIKFDPKPFITLFRSGFTGFLLAWSFSLYGQSFEYMNMPLTGAGRGAVAWCDFDNDHDLDLLVCGLGPGDDFLAKIYRNDEGAFVDITASLIPVKESAAAWGDMDQDGDFDLLLAGNSASGDITRIYRNDLGQFIEVDAGLPGVRNGAVCWVDADLDGDLDVFITGNWLARLYLNSDGAFIDSGQDFGFFSSSAASFGDFDNDGDADLLITGDSGAGAVSKVFVNEGGFFFEFPAGLAGLMAGTAHWVDFDNDGDPDIALSGYNDALEAQFHLYKNEDQKFNPIYAGIDGFAIGAADWGDADNDGDLDFIMTGKATGCGAFVSGVYRNDGNDLFYKTSVEFTTATRASVQWADYDNDGDLDFVVAGLNINDVPFTKLYRNTAGSNAFGQNTAPQSPLNLVTEVSGDEVLLAWSDGADNETPVAALSYNLCIGSQPGWCDKLSPLAITGTGQRSVITLGNAGQNNTIIIKSFAPGTYYWSVQSVDQCFAGSAFATWQPFTITATGTREGIAETGYPAIYPNPARDKIRLTGAVDGTSREVTLLNAASQKVFAKVLGADGEIDISGLAPGIYVILLAGARGDKAPVFIKTGF